MTHHPYSDQIMYDKRLMDLLRWYIHRATSRWVESTS